MGLWSVTNTSTTMMMTLDLVFAIHAGNQGGAWLFDNESILPGQTLDGTWRIIVVRTTAASILTSPT
jgi:hypothetical protein